VADVTQPLVGADFLAHCGLLVDCKEQRLLDGDTSFSAPAQATSSRIPSVNHQRQYTSRQHSLRVSEPHSHPWNSTRGASQHLPPHPHHTRPTTTLPPTSTSTGQARYCQRRIRRHVARWHRPPLRQFLVLLTSHHAQEGQRLASLRSAERPNHSRPLHDYSHQLSGFVFSLRSI
jgi:hypothetical protein